MNASLFDLYDLYIDYLISTFGATTTTGLSNWLKNKVSHDKIIHLLAGPPLTSTDLWLLVKSLVRPVENEEGGLITGDCINHKPCTDENEIVCWHYDHTTG